MEELGTGDLSDLILQVGGPIFVVLALLGLIVMLRTKKQDHRQLGRQQEFMYFIFFAIWILGVNLLWLIRDVLVSFFQIAHLHDLKYNKALYKDCSFL